MSFRLKDFFFIFFLSTILVCKGEAQSARDVTGPAAVVTLISEPPPKLIVDTPLSDQLALGHVVIQYRTENLRVEPVYGEAALKVSPRIGHNHVTIDDAPWHWADASNQPIVIVGMKPGPHKVLLQMADPTHKVLQSDTLYFDVPEIKQTNSSHH